ncbi:MAG: DUF1828 domain-containing protein [Daejeonella sp.]|uniref:DUF1828 domain-containing protein n=1 Tax=Daejeonella sp. TaxID=2805397 RepID=UPI002733528F|nr:DUF1828 domain-containing protein [Daejeonella sp.]MDP3468878.1 DUF1828 domain-containing protein [Daejeonella sp.]
MNWINALMEDYYAFLKEKTLVTANNSSTWVEISTPFVGLFNDTVDIYAKKEGNKIILSDDGNTLRDLELSGLEITRSPKRKEILDRILINYGVRINNEELTTEATERDFPQKKLNLISAISETSDMYYLAKHTVASVFREDVKAYLDEQELIYTPYFISKGSTGLEFTFDFQIAYRNTEIVIKSFNSVNKMNLPHFLFTWDDIKKVREQQTQKEIIGLAVINDIDREVSDEYLSALDNKGAQYILWSQRHTPENINKLKLVA